MKKKQILAVVLAAAFTASLFGSFAHASETTPETNEAGLPIETEAPATEAAPETETAAPEETAAPAETEAAAAEAVTEAPAETETEEEVQSETEFNQHPEAHISLPYDDPDMWWQLVMPNPAAIDTGVNIRDSRSEEEGEIIGFLYEGNGAWLLEKGDEWTELYTGGMTGFVRNEYLLYGEEARAIVDNYALVGVTATWDGTPIYAAPDGASEVVKTLDIGDDLLIAEDGDHWVQVRLDKETTAYASLDDVRKCRFLNAGMPKNGDYGELPEETEPETEEQEETAAEQTEAYVAPQTEYVAPQTEYVAPKQTEAPQTEAPKQTEAPQTEAPQTEAPQTEAPQTEAPQTEAPQTEAPQTEAEAPATEANEDASISEGEDAEIYIDDGSSSEDGGTDEGGWYDADTGKYYDENGKEITG